MPSKINILGELGLFLEDDSIQFYPRNIII